MALVDYELHFPCDNMQSNMKTYSKRWEVQTGSLAAKKDYGG